MLRDWKKIFRRRSPISCSYPLLPEEGYHPATLRVVGASWMMIKISQIKRARIFPQGFFTIVQKVFMEKRQNQFARGFINRLTVAQNRVVSFGNGPICLNTATTWSPSCFTALKSITSGRKPWNSKISAASITPSMQWALPVFKTIRGDRHVAPLSSKFALSDSKKSWVFLGGSSRANNLLSCLLDISKFKI